MVEFTDCLIGFMLIIFSVRIKASIDLNGIYGSLERAEFVYQRPSLTKPGGVLFLAHGCSHSATDWWPKSTTCVDCIGLPVETTIVKEAIKRNYFVVALSSSNREHKCWSNDDIEISAKLIKHIYSEFLTEDFTIPLYLLGGSSGGSFVGILGSSQVTKPLVSAVCIQIMSLRSYAQLPPTLFVLMTKDANTLRNVQSRLTKLSNQSSDYNTHKVLKVDEQKITPSFFFDHGQALTMVDSQTLHSEFVRKAVISASTHLLHVDPRTPESTWREVRHCTFRIICLENDLSIVPFFRWLKKHCLMWTPSWRTAVE
jgi:hypothetical protein